MYYSYINYVINANLMYVLAITKRKYKEKRKEERKEVKKEGRWEERKEEGRKEGKMCGGGGKEGLVDQILALMESTFYL